jgi:penicillin-binding protein 1B
LPAQVYAEPLELYAGQSFGADTLEQELKRLGYRRTDQAEEPGSRSPRRASIWSIELSVLGRAAEPQLISIATRGNSVEACATAATRTCRSSA